MKGEACELDVNYSLASSRCSSLGDLQGTLVFFVRYVSFYHLPCTQFHSPVISIFQPSPPFGNYRHHKGRACSTSCFFPSQALSCFQEGFHLSAQASAQPLLHPINHKMLREIVIFVMVLLALASADNHVRVSPIHVWTWKSFIGLSRDQAVPIRWQQRILHSILYAQGKKSFGE